MMMQNIIAIPIINGLIAMGSCQRGESRFFPLTASANLIRAQRHVRENILMNLTQTIENMNLTQIKSPALK